MTDLPDSLARDTATRLRVGQSMGGLVSQYMVLRTLDRDVLKSYGPMSEAAAQRVFSATKAKHPASRVQLVQLWVTYEQSLEAALKASVREPARDPFARVRK